MSIAPKSPGILLVDDGELDEVARVLDEQGTPYTRLRGGQIPSEVAPPRDLLIVTPRRVDRVRRGSPPTQRRAGPCASSRSPRIHPRCDDACAATDCNS